jgi:hypothetical protein
VDCYSFNVTDFHRLLLAGFPGAPIKVTLRIVGDRLKPDFYAVLDKGRGDNIASLHAVSKALRPEGLFAFSVEAAEFSPHSAADVAAFGYWLTPTRRYVHTQEFLAKLARCNDFEIKLLRKVRLRTERRRPVMGWLTIWTADARQKP